MKRPVRLILAAAIIAVIWVAFLRRDNAATMMAASYTGTLAIDGAVSLNLAVSPPVGAPRDTLELQLDVTNNSPSAASPQIEIVLPTLLRVETDQLPTGVTTNLTTNTLQWLPVLPVGRAGQLAMPIKVGSADLTRPEQNISVRLITEDGIRTASATVWIGIAPHVVALENKSLISVGQPLTFAAQVQGPGPYSEIWNLGDGRRVAVNSPTIVYPAAGVYDVDVIVRNPVGESKFSTSITVVPHVKAEFRPEDDTIAPGQTVSFSNVGGGQGPVDYWWDFGDGATSIEEQPSHTFLSPGVYNVRLLAENNFGVSEASHTITVGLPPDANILVENGVPAGTSLSGEVAMASPSGPGTAFTWEMGDGRRYQSSKVSHVYRRSGDYYVTVTAANEFGETQVGQWVHIDEGIQQVFMPMIGSLDVVAKGSSVDTITQLINTSADDIAVEGTFVMESIKFSASSLPEERLLAYINEARRQFELPELSVSPELSSAANKHTADMATAHHNEHTGSDGSLPADRFLQFGYGHGYAGEATAWGFADPRQAVEFWVNSPGHRPIILNRWATEVGLGYTVDYTAPGVWYWTAEFGNATAAADSPVLRVQTPTNEHEILNSETVTFSWNWPSSLAAEELFTVYLAGQNGLIPVGSSSKPADGTRYTLAIKPVAIAEMLGEFQWVVRLENNRGVEILSSEARTLTIHLDPNLPTATPNPTQLPTFVPSESNGVPTITPTATPTTQPPTPRPTETPLPIFVTATPSGNGQ